MIDVNVSTTKEVIPSPLYTKLWAFFKQRISHTFYSLSFKQETHCLSLFGKKNWSKIFQSIATAEKPGFGMQWENLQQNGGSE